ncbi:MAG: RHS repeat-associated core domain-containing protein [Terriglobia bacterium]
MLDATYAPQGAVAGALLGFQSGGFGGITFAATYTNRLLPYTVTATSSAGSALNLTFGYYANANVETITNNLNTGRTQTFTYDNLNRLATAQTQATSGQYCWGQSFGYDRYANLLSATVTQCTAFGLTLGVNTNNQITNPGFTYDASGDMTSDGTYTYVWDARNRLQSAGGVTYTYDGDGKRVMKSSGTLYWNSPGGTPLAETNSSGATLNEYIFFDGNRVARRDSSGNVYYYFQDQLGTAKTLTISAGVVCYDADFLPYGQEMAYTNSCAQNYKFTGLERDGETGLDHTLHRMYESTLGRWLTPDRHRADPLNPQSWNRYAYVLDNPINFTDPYGLVNVWQAIKGVGEVLLGGCIVAASIPAEAPTSGASTVGILGGGSMAGAGLINISGGSMEIPNSSEFSTMYLTLSNPLGALVGGVTGNLNYAEGASLLFDTANVLTDMAEALSNPLSLSGLNYLTQTLNTAAGVVQYADQNTQEPIYSDGNVTTVIVTDTAMQAPVFTSENNSQLVDQDAGSDGGDDDGGGGGGTSDKGDDVADGGCIFVDSY